MDTHCILLPFLLAVPLFGAVVGAFIPNGAQARHWALLIGLVTFAISVALGYEFYRIGTPLGFHPVSYQVASLGFSFSLHVDAIGLWLTILTAFLTPLATAFSFGSIQEREREYYAWMNALLVAML